LPDASLRQLLWQNWEQQLFLICFFSDIVSISIKIPTTADLEPIISEADVVLDFTNSEVAMDAIRIAANHNVPIVTGSTGFNAEMVKEIETISDKKQIRNNCCSQFCHRSCLNDASGKNSWSIFRIRRFNRISP
jgi:hypothetical protein